LYHVLITFLEIKYSQIVASVGYLCGFVIRGGYFIRRIRRASFSKDARSLCCTLYRSWDIIWEFKTRGPLAATVMG